MLKNKVAVLHLKNMNESKPWKRILSLKKQMFSIPKHSKFNNK